MIEPARIISKISLVLADVDGTLVTKEKVLTPHAAAAVQALYSTGIAFAITGRRPPRGMAMLTIRWHCGPRSPVSMVGFSSSPT
jgi:hypothetical protein